MGCSASAPAGSRANSNAMEKGENVERPPPLQPLHQDKSNEAHPSPPPQGPPPEFEVTPQAPEPPPLLSMNEKPPPDPQNAMFSEAELARIRKRFNSVACLHEDDGLIDYTEFHSVLKTDPCLFTNRLFALFDRDSNGTITMEEFIGALGMLSRKGTVADKTKLSFGLWDINNDGVISRSELFDIIKSSIQTSGLLISDQQMLKLIDASLMSVKSIGSPAATAAYTTTSPPAEGQANAKALSESTKNGNASLSSNELNSGISMQEYEKYVQVFPHMINLICLDINEEGVPVSAREAGSNPGSAREV